MNLFDQDSCHIILAEREGEPAVIIGINITLFVIFCSLAMMSYGMYHSFVPVSGVLFFTTLCKQCIRRAR